MAVPIQLKGQENSTRQKVDSTGAALVNLRLVPDILSGRDDPLIPFRQDFTDDGTATGSTDFLVDGTASGNQDFWIPASEDRDRYIQTISFVIADSGSALGLFGGGAALTNGCRFFWSRLDLEADIHPAIKKNLDLVRMGSPSVGDGANAFLAGGLGGAPPQDGYPPIIKFNDLFGLPWGIRLVRGSTERLTIRINDDLTGGNPDEFGAIAYGFERLPD